MLHTLELVYLGSSGVRKGCYIQVREELKNKNKIGLPLYRSLVLDSIILALIFVYFFSFIPSLHPSLFRSPSLLHSLPTSFFYFSHFLPSQYSSICRLGRLRAGGAKGPGLFFIMPCIGKLTIFTCSCKFGHLVQFLH